MGDTTLLADQVYQPGKQSFAPVDVVAGATALIFSADCKALTDPGVEIVVDLEESRDGGKSWRYMTGSRRIGGPAKNDDGTDSKEAAILIAMGEPQKVDRQFRGSITINGAALQTSAACTIA